MNRRRLMINNQKESRPIVYYSSDNGFESDLSGNNVVLYKVGGTVNDDGTLHLNANSYNYAYIYLKPLGIFSDGNHTIEFQFSFSGDVPSGKWIFTPSVAPGGPITSGSTSLNGWYYSLIVGAGQTNTITVTGMNALVFSQSPGFKKDVIYTLRYTYNAGIINLNINNDFVYSSAKTYEPDVVLFGKTFFADAYNSYIPEMNIHSIKIFLEKGD